MSQKFLNLVKIQFFYEFLKLALLRARPSTRENGTSDVISGHCKSRSSDSPVVFCVGKSAIRIGLSSKELLVDSTEVRIVKRNYERKSENIENRPTEAEKRIFSYLAKRTHLVTCFRK